MIGREIQGHTSNPQNGGGDTRTSVDPVGGDLRPALMAKECFCAGVEAVADGGADGPSRAFGLVLDIDAVPGCDTQASR